MKIGDKIRFLSEIGGGRVSGFQGRGIVLVEDEDGFEIPMSVTDVVVVESDDYRSPKAISKDNNKIETSSVPDGRSVKQKLSEGMVAGDTIEEEYDPADMEVTFRAPVEERKGGNKLSAYLAFVPIDEKDFTNTRFECYLINDSNYYLHYSYLVAENQNWQLHMSGEIEPNTKCFIEEIGRELLNEMEHIAIQMIAYKKDKAFILKHVVDVQLRIDPVKFYKLHCFKENDFFEQQALLFTIIENDEQQKPFVIDSKKLKQEMYRKIEDDNKPTQKTTSKVSHDEILVVDLHANEILETTSGMTNGDILEYQLKIFRDTLAEHSNHRGQKIIFIHGKGEGVLRRSLINELNYKYKRYHYQDASFQEYGYGATQVTIR